MAQCLNGLNPHQKRFMELFSHLTRRHQSWQVWSDFVTMAACSLASPFDPTQEREKRYMETISRYDAKEQTIFPQLFVSVVEGLEADPEQDFLGVLFMQLDLGSHWKGQFFTPYHLSKLMAEIQMVDLVENVTQQGHIYVNDPACGAGAMLIAFANAALKKGVNYQEHVIFVAQDIDHTAAMMCYIQLSLLGCPGYVIVGDTLAHPPTEPMPAHTQIWYTPMYYTGSWQWRKLFRNVEGLFADEHHSRSILNQEQSSPDQDIVVTPELNDSIMQQLTFF